MSTRWTVTGWVSMGLCLTGLGACADMGQPAGPGRGPGLQGGPTTPGLLADASAPSAFDPFGLGFGIGPATRPERLGAKPVQADSSPPAIGASSLVIAPDGAHAVIADTDRDEVIIVDLIAGRTVGRVSLEQGAQPGRIALDSAGSGHAHVVLRGTGAVAKIALSDASLVASRNVCQHPRGLAVDSAAGQVVVACAGGDIVRLSLTSHAKLSTSYVETDLRDVVVTDDGLFVSRFRSAELLKLSADGTILQRRAPAMAHSVRAFAFPEFLLDDGSFPFDAGLPIFGEDEPVSFSPRLAWRTFAVGNQIIMLHQRAQNEAVQTSPGGYGGGCLSVTHPTVTTFEPDVAPVAGPALGETVLAVDASVSPDGKRLAMADPSQWLQGLRTTSVHDMAQLQRQPPEGEQNVGCTFPSAGSDRDSQVVAVAYGPDGILYTFSRDAQTLRGYETVEGVDAFADAGIADAGMALDAGAPQPGPSATDASIGSNTLPIVIGGSDGDFFFGDTLEARLDLNLGGDSVRDTGHDLFHANAGGGISCASCHGELTDDGHVWNFEGIGPRRTQNMRGGFLATAPLHWDGDMPSFQTLVDDVMTGRMGGFVVEKPFAKALGAWIDGQPALRLPARDTDAAARGKALFEQETTACSSCHGGPQRTNNGSYKVGTGGLMQVPGLQGLGLRAPYMHDGCAETLRERFTDTDCGGGDKHGKTSQLSASEVDDLVSYLETL